MPEGGGNGWEGGKSKFTLILDTSKRKLQKFTVSTSVKQKNRSNLICLYALTRDPPAPLVKQCKNHLRCRNTVPAIITHKTFGRKKTFKSVHSNLPFRTPNSDDQIQS